MISKELVLLVFVYLLGISTVNKFLGAFGIIGDIGDPTYLIMIKNLTDIVIVDYCLPLSIAFFIYYVLSKAKRKTTASVSEKRFCFFILIGCFSIIWLYIGCIYGAIAQWELFSRAVTEDFVL